MEDALNEDCGDFFVNKSNGVYKVIGSISAYVYGEFDNLDDANDWIDVYQNQEDFDEDIYGTTDEDIY